MGSLPASEPTDASPGTEEKLAVLCQRAEAGEDLWHDDDRPGDAWRVGVMLPTEGGEVRSCGRRVAGMACATMEAKLMARGHSLCLAGEIA